MSYSFTVRAPTKREASLAVNRELACVAVNQPVHAADIWFAQATADNFIGLLNDDETHDVRVAVSGYLSWTSGNSDGTENSGFIAASVNVTASLASKEAASNG